MGTGIYKLYSERRIVNNTRTLHSNLTLYELGMKWKNILENGVKSVVISIFVTIVLPRMPPNNNPTDMHCYIVNAHKNVKPMIDNFVFLNRLVSLKR